jgi:hypothetical protein
MRKHGGRLAGLLGDLRGSSFVQTIILASVLGLGAIGAVKNLSGQISRSADCVGQRIIDLDLGAGGCREGAPANVETAVSIPVRPAGIALSAQAPQPTPTPVPVPSTPAPPPPAPTPPPPAPTPPPPAPSPLDVGLFLLGQVPAAAAGLIGGENVECNSPGCEIGQGLAQEAPGLNNVRDAIAGAGECLTGGSCAELNDALDDANNLGPFLESVGRCFGGSCDDLPGAFGDYLSGRVRPDPPRPGTRAATLGGSAPTGEKPNSTVLGNRLEEVGSPRPPLPRNQLWAHHIVAGEHPDAQQARDILEGFGIGINDPGNGVFLPASKRVPNPTGAAVHGSLHTEDYYAEVNRRLVAATTREEALVVLEEIRQELLAGETFRR